MLHGNAESSASWYGWVPTLARHYRVVRPDMRGFGASTPMPRDFPWTLDRHHRRLLPPDGRAGRRAFHLVGAKIGGTIARAFAARRPDRVRTLTVAGTPPPFRAGAAERVPALSRMFEQHGVEYWARADMAGRLGSTLPAGGRRVVDASSWAAPPLSTQIGFMRTIACADIRADVPKIACPTLVITTEGSGLASVDETRAWQQTIPDSSCWCCPAIRSTSRRATPSARPGDPGVHRAPGRVAPEIRSPGESRAHFQQFPSGGLGPGFRRDRDFLRRVCRLYACTCGD